MDVFHVSGSGKTDEVLSEEAFERRFPAAHELMNSQESRYIQFGDEEKNVIVKREPANRFNPSQIIR